MSLSYLLRSLLCFYGYVVAVVELTLGFCRCPLPVVVLCPLYSCQGVNFRFKEWSSRHNRQSFSPLRCRMHRWDHLVFLFENISWINFLRFFFTNCQYAILLLNKLLIHLPLLRRWIQIVMIHRTPQTVELQLIRPEKYWQDGRHTGKIKTQSTDFDTKLL